MKIPVLFIWISILPIFSYAAQNNGIIDKLQPGTYQLLYPNQSIDIYFNFLPTNGFENVFIEYNYSESERYEIVKIIKEQIDDLPNSFIDNYLDIDIFPLHIKNGTEFGYVFDRQIVIESSKIKYNMSFKNSIKSSLIHELGHKIENDLNTRIAVIELQNYLEDLQENLGHQDNGNMYTNNIYQSGYVSRYASGDISQRYSASEEFAEMLAHIVCSENRPELIEYIEDNPESLLTAKVNHFMDFLDLNIPQIGRSYLFPEKEIIIDNPGEKAYLDGESLLAAHEQKSNEVHDFNSFDNDIDYSPANMESEPEQQEVITQDWPSPQDEVEYTVYSNSPYSDTYTKKQTKKEKKSKKRKKRRGRGLLIAGTALYIALQLMK